MTRGFCGIGILNYLHNENLGGLFRSAMAFDADFIYTIGRKYKKQAIDTPNSAKHIPCYNYPSIQDFLDHLPAKARLICVETNTERTLENFCHPEQAVYLLGREDSGLPQRLTSRFTTVKIPTQLCLNVATAGSIVLYDRAAKMTKIGAKLG